MNHWAQALLRQHAVIRTNRVDSVWMTVEKPILESKGKSINYIP